MFQNHKKDNRTDFWNYLVWAKYVVIWLYPLESVTSQQ